MTLAEAEPNTDIESSAETKVRFTQRERRGAFLGLTWPQLFVCASGMVWFAGVAIFAFETIFLGLVGAVLIISLGTARMRHVPVVTLLAQSFRYMLRSARGQTRFRRDVWARVSTTKLPTGNPPEMIPVPSVRKSYRLPGAVGDVQFIEIPERGGFTYNVSSELAAATVSVSSEPWKLMDAGKREAAYEGFTSWMSELENMTGLYEAVIRVRVDRAAATGLTDYAATRDELRDIEISKELIDEYNEVVESASASAMEFTSFVTLILDTRTIRSEVRDAGGGLAGLGAIISDSIDALNDALKHCQVQLDEWLDAEQLDDLVGTSFDPIQAASRRDRFGRSRRQMRSRGPVMGVDENWATLRADQSWHQTLWMAEWPRTQVNTGFLERLMYAGNSTRCITLQMRPVPLHKAMTEVSRAQADMDTAENVRVRFNAPTRVLHKRERADLEKREEELADGYSDMRFRAFVTVSAESEAELRRSRTALEQAAYGRSMALSVLRGQQWPAFVTACLPIGTRKG